MKYYFEIIFKLEKNNLFNICIDVVCLALGFLIAIIFIGQASVAYTDYMNNKKGFLLDDYLVCIPQTDSIRLLRNDLEKMIDDYNEIDSIHVFNRQNGEMLIFQQSFCPETTIIEVTEHYFDIFEKEYIIGNKVINDSNAVIGGQSAEQYGINIGDEVIISNKEFNICGIVDIPQYDNSIFILENSIEIFEPYDCQYFFKII